MKKPLIDKVLLRFATGLIPLVLALVVVCLPVFGEDMQLDIKTNQFGNLHIARDVVEVSAYLHGLDKRLEKLLFEGDIRDREGRVIRDFREKVENFTGGVAQGLIDRFRLRTPGLYTIYVEARYQGARLANAETDFAIVASPSFTDFVDEIPFGLILKPERGHPYYEIGRQLENLNIEWIKIPFYWHDLDVAACEEAVERLHARDVRLVGQLAGISREAARTQDDRVCGELGPRFASTPPKDYRLWEEYVHDVVSRYRERIHYWEIWMDPEGGSGPNWQGTAEEFAELFVGAARAIKRADPEARIVNSGLLNQASDFGVRVAKETSELTDIIGLENSPLIDLPLTNMPDKWQEASEVVPLWVTDSRGGSAAATARDYVLSKTEATRRSFRYGYREAEPTRRVSSFVSESFTPTDNAIVYSALSNLLEESDFLEELAIPGEAKCFVFMKELTRYFVLWHEDDSLLGNRRWPVGLHIGAWWPKKFDMYGHRDTLGPFWRSNMTLWVGEEPIVLQAPITASVYPVSPSTWKVKMDRRKDWIILEAEHSNMRDPGWREQDDLNYSGGRALRLTSPVSESAPPPFLYEFELQKTGYYEILIAGSPLSELPWIVSPFEWQMDQDKKRTVNSPCIEERIYADKKAGLTSLGTMNLGCGRHLLGVYITDPPASGAAEHDLLIDCIILRPAR